MIFSHKHKYRNYNAAPPTSIHYNTVIDVVLDEMDRLMLFCGKGGSSKRSRWTMDKRFVDCKRCIKKMKRLKLWQ